MATDNGKLRVAAIGDLHVMENSVAPYRELFAEISHSADVLVLCGDLTNFGKTSEAEILAEEHRPLIFTTKTPQSVNTFLVDGAIAGKWSVKRTAKKAELLVEPFEKLPAKAKKELQSEGEGLVRFHEPDAARRAENQNRLRHHRVSFDDGTMPEAARKDNCRRA